MKFIISWIFIFGFLTLMLGMWGVWDFFVRDLDRAIGVSAMTRLLGGSAFIAISMGLNNLKGPE